MSTTKDLRKSIFKTFKNFSIRKRWQFLFIFILNIFTGYFEFLTIGTVGIFLASLTASQSIYQSKELSFFLKILGAKQTSGFELQSLIIFISILFLSTIIRVTNLWINTKFRVSFIKEISKKSFRNVLSQDYEYHIYKNSSELISDLTTHVDKSVGFIDQLLYIFFNIFIAFGIITALLIVNARLTILISFIIVFIYIIITSNINKKISRYGQIEVNANKDIVQILQEGLGSIKNVILENNNGYHTGKFEKSVGIARKYQSIVSLLAQSPKFIIEALGFTILSIIGYSISINQNNINGLAFLGSFALGAQKLLPAIQNIYSSWTNLISYNKGYEKVLKLLELKINKHNQDANLFNYSGPIQVRNISFKYPQSLKNSLENISFTINRGEKIGLMGKTGSGKTTFINILMGLLRPQSGSIFANEIDIFDESCNQNIISWRKKIGHVPQKIYLHDSTILENIALFQEKDQVDLKKAKSAANKACLLDYINSTKDGFHTIVGEEGISLSGGQIQRLGIARAFYKDLDLLILDEATSALDNITEKKLIKNIDKFSKKLTLFVIAHRLKTLEMCDKVIEFKDGKIARIITGDELKLENSI